MNSNQEARLMAWVGSELLPHEADVRAWLRRTLDSADMEDVIQEAYCQIASLTDVSHIRQPRAYFFQIVRNIVLMRLRRARVVRIDTVSEIDHLDMMLDAPSPERITSARQELEQVRRLIDDLPDRCRQIFELRKIEGLSQREVAQRLNIAEHIVENDVAKGLKLILRAIADGEKNAEQALKRAKHNDRTRNSTGD